MAGGVAAQTQQQQWRREYGTCGARRAIAEQSSISHRLHAVVPPSKADTGRLIHHTHTLTSMSVL